MFVVLLVPVFLERASTFFCGCESVIARCSFGSCQFIVMRVDERGERSGSSGMGARVEYRVETGNVSMGAKHGVTVSSM